MNANPTPYPEVNALLEQVLAGAQSILGSRFVGMYVDGSLASGDFDQDSDIDFVVVTREAVSAEDFAALQALHDRLSALETPWAIQLEGFYVSQALLRRHNPAHGSCPNLERGWGERLKMVQPGEVWDIHRWVLRERGIVVTGPAPQTLIDPVPPERLRAVMGPGVASWLAYILDNPASLSRRGGQSYIVLTLCRILYTLDTGAVASKPTAARWAQQNLDPRWSGLIERAWEGRHNPDENASAEEVMETLEMIREVLKKTDNR